MQEQSFLSAFDRLPRRLFKNKSGFTAPAWGVMRIITTADLNGEICYDIGRPNSEFQVEYVVNGPTDVANDGYGLCTTLRDDGPVLYDFGASPPIEREEWGPKKDSWTLHKNRYGFWIVGHHVGASGKARVMARQRGVSMVFGKTVGQINKGATNGNCDLLDQARADTGDDLGNIINPWVTIGPSKTVMIAFWGTTRVLLTAECPLT